MCPHGRSDLAPWPIALGHSVRHRQLSLSPWVVSVSCSTKPLTSLNISHQEPLALYWPFRSPFWLLWIMKCYRRICALGQQCWHSTVLFITSPCPGANCSYSQMTINSQGYSGLSSIYSICDIIVNYHRKWFQQSVCYNVCVGQSLKRIN